MSADSWMSAGDAARTLGVTRPTLYAYVSRGLIRSQPGNGATRERRYATDDVQRLKRRADERRDPGAVAAHALAWGMPVLESSITLIADDTLYYRGHDAAHLARTASVEAVASLIWTGRLEQPVLQRARARRAPSVDADPFIVRAQAHLALASASDPQAFDLRPDAVVRTAWRILDLMVASASGRSGRATGEPIDEALARAWRARAAAKDVIRAALILVADHELNVSAFTARCVASAGATPYAAVIAGLSALEGVRHGGSTARVESLLTETRRVRSVRATLTERLRHGHTIDGFGHPLYQNGDPRASTLLAMLAEQFSRSAELRFVREFARVAESLSGEKPNVDFALSAVSRVLKLPPSSGLTLFAIGRTIGWIGHAIEQYEQNAIIRPRAKYVGENPPA